MDCHKCGTAKEIEAGKWAGVVWAKTPCAKCVPVESQNHHGRTHVSFTPNLHDAQAAGGADIEMDEAQVDQIFAAESLVGTHENHRTPAICVLSFMAKTIIGLPERTREIVLDRLAYPDRSLRIVAERLGISVKTAHDRLKRARADWPALSVAIPMKSWAWGDGKSGRECESGTHKAKRGGSGGDRNPCPGRPVSSVEIEQTRKGGT